MTPEPRAQADRRTSVGSSKSRTSTRVIFCSSAPGPGLGASVARRFARELYRPTLVARSAPAVARQPRARTAFDELLNVAPEQLAAAYAVDVIGAVLTRQLAVPALRVAGGGTLLFTGGGFADALPGAMATLSLGKLALSRGDPEHAAGGLDGKAELPRGQPA